MDKNQIKYYYNRLCLDIKSSTKPGRHWLDGKEALLKRILTAALLLTITPIAGCELCTDPSGCECYMDDDGDDEGDNTTGRPVKIEEGEMCPSGYYIEED